MDEKDAKILERGVPGSAVGASVRTTQRSLPRTPQAIATAATYEVCGPSDTYFHDPKSLSKGGPSSAVPRVLPTTTKEQGAATSTVEDLAQNMRRVLIGEQDQTVRVITNPTTQVETRVQSHPARDITDPELLRRGVSSVAKLLETPGDAEVLFESYRKRSQPRRFFKLGRVFMVLWAEPANGDANTLLTYPGRAPGTTLGRYGEPVYSSVRRFVVIREAETYCSALPISTYHGRGVAKPGTKKSEHAIIYTGKQAPDPRPDERPSRAEGAHAGMRSLAIRIETDSPVDKLDPMSRINFGAVYTIQHNIKVKPYGQVHESSRENLLMQFLSVWNRQLHTADPTEPVKSKTASSGQKVLDPELENAAIRRLMATGLSELEARESLRRRVGDLLVAQGRSRADDPTESGLSDSDSANRSPIHGKPGNNSPRNAGDPVFRHIAGSSQSKKDSRSAQKSPMSSSRSIEFAKVEAMNALMRNGNSPAEARQNVDAIFGAQSGTVGSAKVPYGPDKATHVSNISRPSVRRGELGTDMDLTGHEDHSDTEESDEEELSISEDDAASDDDAQ